MLKINYKEDAKDQILKSIQEHILMLIDCKINNIEPDIKHGFNNAEEIRLYIVDLLPYPLSRNQKQLIIDALFYKFLSITTISEINEFIISVINDFHTRNESGYEVKEINWCEISSHGHIYSEIEFDYKSEITSVNVDEFANRIRKDLEKLTSYCSKTTLWQISSLEKEVEYLKSKLGK